MPHMEEIQPEDPLEQSTYGEHIILNPEKRSVASCSKCGARFYWDGLAYVPATKNVTSLCPGQKGTA